MAQRMVLGSSGTATAPIILGKPLTVARPLSRPLFFQQLHPYHPSTWSRRPTNTKLSSSSSSFSTKASNNRESKKSFMEWYEEQLSARPVFTKMVTGAFLWGLGDVVAQVMPYAVRLVNTTKTNDDEPQSSSQLWDDYDWPRTGRAVIFGFALHAPTAHLHYNFLEWLTVRSGITGGLSVPIFKAFMEQFVYWSWVSNSMYHGAMGAMQGLTPTQIVQRIQDVLWETQKAQWVFWIPVQLLNFRFVPVRHQLNVVLLTSIAWTALLSAWYPPEKKDQKDKQTNENKE